MLERKYTTKKLYLGGCSQTTFTRGEGQVVKKSQNLVNVVCEQQEKNIKLLGGRNFFQSILIQYRVEAEEVSVNTIGCSFEFGYWLPPGGRYCCGQMDVPQMHTNVKYKKKIIGNHSFTSEIVSLRDSECQLFLRIFFIFLSSDLN